MKQKQLEVLQKFHGRYCRAVEEPAPELAKHINLALVSGDPLRVKSRDDLVKLCREKLVVGYHDRELRIHQIFESCPAYDRELKEYQARQKDGARRLASYLKVAEPLMRKAELVEDADPEEIATQLTEAAEANGLA